jgi:CheY-like chemotaxis protein
MNLVSNAIKFTPQGKKVAIRVSYKNELMTLQIQDEGIGIAANRLAHIFEPFEQADNSITRRFGGTGLGLTISKRLIEILGGTITVTSEEGRGSTFTINIPLKSIDNDIATPQTLQLFDNQFSNDNIILAAEDNKLNREMLALLFEELGLFVHFAVNGQEAVIKAQELQPTVILMDLHMPILSGLEATKQIRDIEKQKLLNNENLTPVPIIAVSADAFIEQQDQALALGMNDYVTKPVELETLLPILKKYLTLVSNQKTVFKVIPSEIEQQVYKEIHSMKKISILQPEQIIEHIDKAKSLCSGYETYLHGILNRLEDAVYNADDEQFQEILSSLI